MRHPAPTPIDEVTRTAGLVANTPDWFEDPEFKTWLNDRKNPIFTWHTKGTEPDEWSDIVILVDPSLNGEGVGSDMPERFWNALIELCKAHYKPSTMGTHIFVRLTNHAA
ncbi:hypothetical protein [Marinobacter sp. MBR-105]|jgi:hypothetical protein